MQDDEDRSEGLNSFREINRAPPPQAAKTKRYSVSKRSFDFDKNGDTDKADAEDGGEEEEAERGFISSSAGGESRRTLSSVGSRRDGLLAGRGRTRRATDRGRGSETTNPNNGIGSSVNSSNNNNIPAKFVSVPATDKEKRSSNSNADASIKRVVVKRNVASPRSQSPARAASPRAQSPARVINHS
ncbi:hypothetical protein Bca52824_060186 [Brassica carinata]|uniref:Uncharacterized protein n=1 Tax=Brassica carinata TaxID=52824 RepID=A0A8X7QX10_BRACI|nr:hypothetical protein Bca52824_060186 [Brassica carinata]